MEENKTTEVTTQDNVEVTVEAKESFGTKLKNGAKKVFSSKPAKIVGGVVLAAGGAIVGYSFANRNTTEIELEDLDYDDFDAEVSDVEDESAIAD